MEKNIKEETNRPVVRLRLGAQTHMGCVRTNNEDNFLVSTDLAAGEWVLPQDSRQFFPLNGKGAMLVIADGMGGLDAGEVASQIAVDTVKEWFAPERIAEETLHDEQRLRACLCDAIKEADRRIKARSKKEQGGKPMGTTVVVAWLLEGYANIAWCGDSRAYLYNTVSGLVQKTKDHSYVQELVDSGQLLPEYAFDHPDSNIITRSLGNPRKAAEPDFVRFALREEETLLLCTDGLNGMLRDEEIEALMQENCTQPDVCLKKLIQGALDAGGHDNVTLILCQTAPNDTPVNAETQQPTLTTHAEKEKPPRRKPARWLLGVLGLLLAGGLLWLFLGGAPADAWKQKLIQWYEQIEK